MDDPIVWQCPLCGEVYASDDKLANFAARFQVTGLPGGTPVPPEHETASVCDECLSRPIRDLLGYMLTPA